MIDGEAGSKGAATTTPEAAPPWLGVYWLLAGALLLGEYLFISLLFDAGAWIELDPPGPLRWLGHLGELATLGAVAVFGTLLLRGRALLADLRALYQPQPLSARVAAFGAHMASYPLLVYTTARIFADPDPERVTALGVGAWLLSAAASVLTLLLTLAPPRVLLALVPRTLPALGVGLLAGVVAFGLGQLSNVLWEPLGGTTLLAVHYALSHLTPQVVLDYDQFVVGTPQFIVAVAPVCSGFEGIGLISVFLGGYIALHRRQLRLPHALWLLPLAIATVWIANTLRIVGLILIGSYVSPEIALGGFHSKAGWVFFCLIAFGFIGWLRSAQTFRAESARTSDHELDRDARHTTAAYLLPQLAILAAMLVTGLFAGEIDLLYGVRVGAGLLALGYFWRTLRPLWVRPGLQSVAIGVLVYGLWFALTDHHSAQGEELHAAVMNLGAPLSALWIVLRVVGSVLVVPVAEELAFRGYVMRRLIDAEFEQVPFSAFSWPAWLLSSLAFGLLHADWLAATAAGLAYGFAQFRSGRLSDAITAHAVTNALVALDVLLWGAWAQW